MRIQRRQKGHICYFFSLLQLTGAGGGGVAFTLVTPDTPEEQVSFIQS